VNRWILRGLTTAGFAGGMWLLGGGNAYAHDINHDNTHPASFATCADVALGGSATGCGTAGSAPSQGDGPGNGTGAGAGATGTGDGSGVVPTGLAGATRTVGALLSSVTGATAALTGLTVLPLTGTDINWLFMTAFLLVVLGIAVRARTA
jgi:hypothetical protein